MKFLAVHPNFELYGSDRAFANALVAIVERIPGYEVTALIPQEGPILELPIFRRIKISIEEFWIPRRTDLPVHRLPLFVARGLRSIGRALWRMNRYDMIYVDTIICLDHIIAARFCRKPVIIHIHEIPLGREMAVFRRILLFSRATLMFNSIATRDAFRLPKGKKDYVIYNGATIPITAPRAFYDGTRPLRLMVIGRLNFWKGQEVLIDAMGRMSAEMRARIEVRIVGGVFGDQDHFREDIEQRIATLGLGETITIHPFTNDPTGAYRWADVVVVPSTRPEPFGRVAIEGMAYSCAVIASGHGGLVESIDDGVTGYLVPPSDPEALRAAIETYLAVPARVAAQGKAGYQRFLERFTDAASDTSFAAAIEDIATDSKS
jgi:glycosyltransferase involved in cell wall biosynthesis